MRKTFLVVNGLLTLAIIAQLYLAALGVFSPPEDDLFQYHGTNGRIVIPVLLILWIVFGFIARIGRTNILLTFAGFVLLALQSVYFLIAGAMGATLPPNASTPGGTAYVLALHGLGGTLLLLLTIWVFFRVMKMGPITRPASETASAQATAGSATPTA